MHHVQLTDQLYQEAKSRAQVAGFASVDEFVAEVLRNGFSEPSDNFDDRFTPAVNAYLVQVASDLEAGNSLSIQEVEEHLNEVRNAWRKS